VGRQIERQPLERQPLDDRTWSGRLGIAPVGVGDRPLAFHDVGGVGKWPLVPPADGVPHARGVAASR